VVTSAAAAASGGRGGATTAGTGAVATADVGTLGRGSEVPRTGDYGVPQQCHVEKHPARHRPLINCTNALGNLATVSLTLARSTLRVLRYNC